MVGSGLSSMSFKCKVGRHISIQSCTFCYSKQNAMKAVMLKREEISSEDRHEQRMVGSEGQSEGPEKSHKVSQRLLSLKALGHVLLCCSSLAHRVPIPIAIHATNSGSP